MGKTRGGRSVREIMSSVVDTIILRCMLDIHMELLMRQLDRVLERNPVWTFGSHQHPDDT